MGDHSSGTMHWSYPAALRFLRVLRARGWTATTWQVLDATRSAAVHSDAASVRSLFRECGVDDWQGSVGCELTGRSEEGRRVHRYWIPDRLRELAARVLQHESTNPTRRGSRPDFTHQRAREREAAARGKVAKLRPRGADPKEQAALF